MSTIHIQYNPIITRCEQLSSFEARDKRNENGQSRYLDIHINDIDKQLVMQYAKQAIALIEQGFDRMITETSEYPTTEDATATTWTLRDDTRWNGTNTFVKHVYEAIVSYTMAQWLSDKLPERTTFYEGMFTASLAMAKKNIFNRQAPTA